MKKALIFMAVISMCGCNSGQQQQANQAAYETSNKATTAMMNNGAVQSAAQVGVAAAEGTSKAIMQPWADHIAREAPTWETTPGKSIQECMTVTGGVVNEAFMRCRHGYQQFVSHKDNGQTVVLQERPIR